MGKLCGVFCELFGAIIPRYTMGYFLSGWNRRGACAYQAAPFHNYNAALFIPHTLLINIVALHLHSIILCPYVIIRAPRKWIAWVFTVVIISQNEWIDINHQHMERGVDANISCLSAQFVLQNLYQLMNLYNELDHVVWCFHMIYFWALIEEHSRHGCYMIR